MTPPGRLCSRGHNTVIRSGKPGPRFSPGDHQGTVGAGAPQRHLLRGNGVKRHRCRRQRQSRCRVFTRSLSTPYRKGSRTPPATTAASHTSRRPHTANHQHNARSSRAAGRSASHRTLPSTMPTESRGALPEPRTTMVPGSRPAAHADMPHARHRAAAGGRIQTPTALTEGGRRPSPAQHHRTRRPRSTGARSKPPSRTRLRAAVASLTRPRQPPVVEPRRHSPHHHAQSRAPRDTAGRLQAPPPRRTRNAGREPPAAAVNRTGFAPVASSGGGGGGRRDVAAA